jgi:membrane protein
MKSFELLRQKIAAVFTKQGTALAASPRDFTFTDWRLALLATKQTIGSKHLNMLAAGSAYFATLAFFPLMAASIAIASFGLNRENISTVVRGVEQYLPKDVGSLISSQLQTALAHQSSSFIVAVIAIAVSLFSISGAIQNLINATNISYDVHETRHFIKLRLISLGVVCAGLLGGAFVVACLLLNTPLLAGVGIPPLVAAAISMLRWAVIALIILLLLAIFYRYAANRSHPKWQWVTWGSIIATILWMLGTALFFVYARYFAHFSDTYSLFAGIVVLMTWFNLSSYIVLLGAVINTQLEHQTLRPTTKK